MWFLFDSSQTLFSAWGYQVSWLEAAGTFSGLLAVSLAARESVYNWPVGLVNVSLFALLFYQSALYPDMLLQGYYFATCLYGWHLWRGGGSGRIPAVSSVGMKGMLQLAAGLLLATFAVGEMFRHLHEWLPVVFPKPTAFPFAGTFVLVGSTVAQWLMVKKKLECWLLWIAVDVVAVWVYFSSGMLLMGLEFGVFLAIASAGGWRWYRKLKADEASN